MSYLKTSLIRACFLTSLLYVSGSLLAQTQTAVASSSDMQPSQQYKGIHFEQGLSWKDILAKAKAEHKYIFVDCYATWCGPCKYMDKNV